MERYIQLSLLIYHPPPPSLCFCAPLWGAGFPQFIPAPLPILLSPLSYSLRQKRKPCMRALYHAHAWGGRYARPINHSMLGGWGELWGAYFVPPFLSALLCNEDLSFLLYSFGGFFSLSARWQCRVTWSFLVDQLINDLVADLHIFVTVNTVHE